MNYRSIAWPSNVASVIWFFLIVILLFLPVSTESPSATIDNFDPRQLTQGDIFTFAPLACSGDIVQGQGGYQTQCQSLSGYPGGGASGPYNLTLTSIIVGHLTDGGSIQAFISYKGDFEDHANNFGGGILFQYGAEGWSLVEWFPSVIMDNCVQLNPVGQARLLCQQGYEGMGEIDSSLWLMTIPSSYDPANVYSANNVPVLRAQDDRQGGDPNYNCAMVKDQNQKLLFKIEAPTPPDRAGFIAMSQISYVDSAVAASFCKKKDLVDAPVTQENIWFSWDGTKLTMTPSYSFAKTDY